MQKLGPSLKYMLRRTKRHRFSLKTGVQIGIQLIHRLRDMHQLGFLHLDLKPENILITTSSMNRLESSKLVLIDYGISQRYLDHMGDHV